MKAKDFQEATAKRIVELFQSGHNRVLLADEVGLGKTIVAKTVVENTYEIIKKEKEEYVVVYICSNAVIAEQNCAKLGIPKGNRISISEGRLSMQHLVLADLANKKSVRLIPMTPSTSFSITGGTGTAAERALAFLVMSYCGICKDFQKEFSIFMRTYFIETNDSWNRTIENQRLKIENLKEHKNVYIEEMKNKIKGIFDEAFLKELEEKCSRIHNSWNQITDNGKLNAIISWEEQKYAINKIRNSFSQISISMLKPDLVIMDEFQRFKDLIEISDDDNSDSAMLSKKFIKNTTSNVLLLSATPYKPYSTLSEIASGEEAHVQGFMRVINFLVNDKTENIEFHNIWNEYSHNLTEILKGDFACLVASKDVAEKRMYEHICRTERRNSGIINTDKACPMSLENISPDSIKSYIVLQKFMNKMRIGNFPIEYVKSAPFLMSFMDYVAKSKIDSIFNEEKKLQEFEKIDHGITNIKVSFLERKIINKYKELPPSNARFNALMKEVFPRKNNNKSYPELLLWIPPANKYYTIGESSVFEQCEGYSKILVFSSWEMVPRMISSLTSYESERLVNQLIKNKSKEQQSYYSLPEDFDKDDKSLSKNKRGKSRFLINEQRELVCYPSVWLSRKYNYKEHYGKTLDSFYEDIKKSILDDIVNVSIGAERSTGSIGAKQIICFLEYMDSKILNRTCELPERLPSEDDIETLVNMAIASPAICLLRSLDDIEDINVRIEKARECSDNSFVSMFNRPESRSIMDAIFQNSSELSDEKHYEQVFHYCVDGNFQSMIDEYKFATGLAGIDFVDAINNSFLQTSNLPYESLEFYKRKFTDHPMNRKPLLRVHFAAGYFDAKLSDKTVQRVNNIRNAFNSPFRPFVLATTSIGQEGLDFHLYCRKIVHWNLPSNPIDLEQREGRINRYLSHAIRLNVAANQNEPEWSEKFELTSQKYRADSSEMVPYWCLPENYPYKYYIERIVPMYPFSQDKVKYDRLINVLALYRLTLGQPRQEEMLSILNSKNLSEKDIEKLFFDLSPYSRAKKSI